MPISRKRRRQIGKRSRRKGKTWERAVAADLREIFGDVVHRGHQDNRGGAGAGEGSDVEGTPYYMECRHEKSYNWRKHLEQTMTRIKERSDPRPLVLVAKEDRKPAQWRVGQPGTPPIAIMLYSDFLRLVNTLAVLEGDSHDNS
jgi:hypothetical protein